jgi:hypothetical protein
VSGGAPLSVGGFTFPGGESAFADDAALVSGTIRSNCTAGPSVSPATSLPQAITGSDLSFCINNNTGNSGVVEIIFVNNLIVNGAGTDLVIFELSGALPAGTPEPRERFGVSIFDGSSFTAFAEFDPVATGLTSFGTPSEFLDVFAVEIDLTSFGSSPGVTVDRVRLHIFDVGAGTKSGDVAALGALNSIPEPTRFALLSAGITVLVALRLRGARTH